MKIGLVIHELSQSSKSILNKINNYAQPHFIKINTFTNQKEETLRVITEINKCSGIIIQGGPDLSQTYIDIASYCHKLNIPIFGICLGMQAMSINNFNQISEDILNREDHEIIINKDTMLYEIIKKDKITVNSFHLNIVENTSHKISSTTLLKTNYIHDKKIINYAIESIEDPTKNFYLATQWHPEYIEEHDKIFQAFFETSKKLSK